MSWESTTLVAQKVPPIRVARSVRWEAPAMQDLSVCAHAGALRAPIGLLVLSLILLLIVSTMALKQ